MPTYTETVDAIKLNSDAIKSVRIARTKDLGDGYRANVKLDTRTFKVAINIKGPNSDIRRIPKKVIVNYAAVLLKVKRWVDDLEPDMPTL